MTRPPPGAKITIRFEFTRCNQARCKKCVPGGRGHGPYEYWYWHEGGRLRKMYVRAVTPGDRGRKTGESEPAKVSSVTQTAHLMRPGKSRGKERARLQKTNSQPLTQAVEGLGKGAELWKNPKWEVKPSRRRATA